MPKIMPDRTTSSDKVTLMQMLKAREDRVLRQRALISAHHCPIISFTMNIAGPVKTSPLIERAFREGLSTLEEKIPQEYILSHDIYIQVTGCEALYAVDMDARELKKICINIEDATTLGRLFDMDVLDTDAVKLERDASHKQNRNCFVCGAPGLGCSAGRLHSVEQLQETTRRIITQYFAKADRIQLASLAVQSLIDEVNTTPKPGLVDQRNNGSHTDMTLQTFLKSARSLKPYFQECVQIGQDTGHLAPSATFPFLRQAGIKAETVMYQATGGVNTHKGIIYTMGILCGSLGRLWTPEIPFASIDSILKEAALIAKESVLSDFSSLHEDPTHCTAGQLLYHTEGLTGIRGEVASGLPSVSQIALPAYKQALLEGYSANDAGVYALLHLICHVQDTNLYHRGGKDGASYATYLVQKLLSQNPYPSMEEIRALDDLFIAKNLSPGGCADLLAVTYFLLSLF